MFKGYHESLSFFRSLESAKEIVSFVVENEAKLEDYQKALAGKVIAEKV